MTSDHQHETPAEILARSAFGFVLLAFITLFITWVGLLFSAPSPDPMFERIRIAILIAAGIFMLITLWITIRSYQVEPKALLPLSRTITRYLQNKGFAVAISAVLLEVNLFAFSLLGNIAPGITGPVKFLLLSWALIFLGILISVNQKPIAKLILKTQKLWVGTGLLIVGGVLVIMLLMLNRWVIAQSEVENRLRGSLDFRALTFFNDGQPQPSAAEFWAEQAQTRVRWSPYTYWVLDEFDGDYINVNADGIRSTPDFGGDMSIYVFGGSTVWGEGARDAYTIPGHMARILNEQGNPQHVLNYGQTGYVSTQDLIWFQLQLATNNLPEIAVFYQGFNDVLSAWAANQSGLTLQEEMRLNDAEAGRLLRSGQPLLRLPHQSLADFDLSAAGVAETTAQAIADRWFANQRIIESIAEDYKIDVLFIWQPAIIYKNPLTAAEQAIYAQWDEQRSGLFELYTEVDAIVRQRVRDENLTDVLILSDLFEGYDATLFHDLVHITEIGNALVAEAIISELETNFLHN